MAALRRRLPEPSSRWAELFLFALPPFLLALYTRLALAVHGNTENAFFYPIATLGGPDWLSDRHSALFALLKSLWASFAGLSHERFMAANGVAGALAVLPLYLFVRLRFASRAAAFYSALLFATSPLLSRFAPTDSHFSLLLLFWFSGVALLSFEVPTRATLLSGCALLGLAGAMRAEGAVYVALGLGLAHPAAIRATLRSRPLRIAAAIGVASALAMAIANALLVRSLWGGQAPEQASQVLLIPLRFVEQPLYLPFDGHRHDVLFVALVLVGVFAALRDPERRAALLVLIALLLARSLVGRAKIMEDALANEHKLLLYLALQAVIGGLGADWLVRRAPEARRAALSLGLAALIAVGGTLLALPELRRVSWFNAEYFLLRDHLASGVDGCSLLWFAQDDEELHSPVEIARRMHEVNCAREDCLAPVRAGRCAYYLEGNQCHTPARLEQGPFAGRTATDACAALKDRLKLSLVAARSAGDRTFAIHRIDGLR
jgi:hypothetical protein